MSAVSSRPIIPPSPLPPIAKPHRQPDRARMHLFAEVGHRNGREARRRRFRRAREARAGLPNAARTAHEIVRSADASSDASISGTRPRASENGPRHDQRRREKARRERQRQTAFRGAHVKVAREHRHQRLHAIQQRERREPGGKQARARIRAAKLAGCPDVGSTAGSATSLPGWYARCTALCVTQGRSCSVQRSERTRRPYSAPAGRLSAICPTPYESARSSGEPANSPSGKRRYWSICP